jgi:hypothetical protein
MIVPENFLFTLHRVDKKLFKNSSKGVDKG